MAKINTAYLVQFVKTQISHTDTFRTKYLSNIGTYTKASIIVYCTDIRNMIDVLHGSNMCLHNNRYLRILISRGKNRYRDKQDRRMLWVSRDCKSWHAVATATIHCLWIHPGDSGRNKLPRSWYRFLIR